MRKNEVFDSEGNVVESVNVPYTKQEITNKLKSYGKNIEDSALTVQDFTENGTEEHRRNAKEALDFIEELGADAPSTIPWSSPNHGVQFVTPAVLKAWLITAGQRRLKRFSAQAAVDLTDLTTPEQVEAAFDAAYEA